MAAELIAALTVRGSCCLVPQVDLPDAPFPSHDPGEGPRPPGPARRTKVVATLGPSTDGPGVLEELVAAGLDVARINCSHGEPEDIRARAGRVREVALSAGRPVALLLDLQGPKLRLDASTPTRELVVGERLTLSGHGPADLQVGFPGFCALVTQRSELVVGDGVPRLRVLEVSEDLVSAEVVVPGPVAPRRGINVTHARPDLPALTEKDLADLALSVELDADFVALSFVRSRADVELLRSALGIRGSRARTVAKIEKVEAFEELDGILEVADAVMVARGDLGIEVGAAAVPLLQKAIIARANQAGRLVITATQMLESMLTSPEPTRAEATDVVNAVIDGTSAVMLSGETSIGAHPLSAVRLMAELATAGEQAPEIHGRARDHGVDATGPAVLVAAVQLAERLQAAAIVVPTQSGAAARECAKYRPRQQIIALAHDPRVVRHLALEWGVLPLQFDASTTVDEMIDRALATVRDEAGLPVGALVVLTAGRRTGTPGATNLLMVREIPAP